MRAGFRAAYGCCTASRAGYHLQRSKVFPSNGPPFAPRWLFLYPDQHHEVSARCQSSSSNFIYFHSLRYLQLQLLPQQRNWFLIAALLVGDEPSCFVHVIFFFLNTRPSRRTGRWRSKAPRLSRLQPGTWQSSPDPSHHARSDTCWGGTRRQHPSLELGQTGSLKAQSALLLQVSKFKLCPLIF